MSETNCLITPHVLQRSCVTPKWSQSENSWPEMHPAASLEPCIQASKHALRTLSTGICTSGCEHLQLPSHLNLRMIVFTFVLHLMITSMVKVTKQTLFRPYNIFPALSLICCCPVFGGQPNINNTAQTHFTCGQVSLDTSTKTCKNNHLLMVQALMRC